ncbi:MAG: hypothetical protein CVV64_16770 [Candidatus Wallbacteria bacterium HGW-Wallbacteria-1]|jgi:hypothetical protein|uniref:Nitrile hydratase alpha/Thiocyanate hydrolase gamma domain-containing protein n=1 Tax=Candidatus Wallbacteria bacterium HGW-Wallbacteria-1 TaxID=2013854 RepID=A0A2N1PKL5_9BACT|nr:MAG: hypothetical protein CVV64_16770 [Candidatus Wallbacteria bacterium HGW-Wallbacteria-1]
MIVGVEPLSCSFYADILPESGETSLNEIRRVKMNFQKLMQDIISNDDFRKELLADTKGTLAKANIDLQPGMEYRTYENGPDTFYGVMPLPTDKESFAILEKLNPTFAKVYQKAWADPDFKAELMENPKMAFKDITGIVPPSALNVIILENTDKVTNFVLPYTPPADAELSDSDLEMVAGGKGASSDNDAACNSLAGSLGSLACAGAAAGGALAGFSFGPQVTVTGVLAIGCGIVAGAAALGAIGSGVASAIA